MPSSQRSPVPLLAASLLAPLGLAQMEASFAERLLHWAWQPLLDVPPPAVTRADWVQDPLDAFVLRELEAKSLQPAAPAPPHVWLRRVHFDLVGLPPTPAEVAAFAADPSATARARIVDELLARPSFGERHARHWLDLVRYAESLGHEFDFDIPNAWRYRDYVVRALNHDMPFDRFGKEHIAGDLLPDPRLDPHTGVDESLAATGFWWFAEQTHGPVDADKHRADRIDNQIDVFSKAFLGVTVACARCHDHKFDAISTADYYSLAGFLVSSHYVQRPLHPTPAAAIERARAAQLRLVDLLRTTEAPDAPDEVDPSRHGWTVLGDGCAGAPWSAPFVVGSTDEELRLHSLPGTWWNSAALARSRDAVLVSPTFELQAPWLHVAVAGEGSRVQLVVDGLHLVRDPLYGRLHRGIDNKEPHWITLDVRNVQGHRACLQVLDVRAHDLADPQREHSDYPDLAWFAVQRMVPSDGAEPPAPLPAGKVLTLSRRDPAVAAAWDDVRAAVAALPKTATTPAMVDGTGTDEHVFFRGDHRQRREQAPRRFLSALDGAAPMPLPAGSGRLQLAERVFAATNPLPARVLVNRAFHHLFGRGLARTVDNLGHLGTAPTHKELLDRLALDTMREGWSYKRLLRRLALSATYAMDSRGDPAADAADPDNDLLHRQNLRRLQGEALRDATLQFAGRLDPTLGGPSVPGPLSADDRARGRPQHAGPVDGNGRRSLYLAVRRNFLPDLLLAFDLPTPFSCVGARSVANVPAQALALANDPLLHAMSRLAADQLLAQRPFGAPPLDEGRALATWFAAAFGRAPTEDETAQCRAFLQVERETLAATVDDPRPWAALAHVLLQRKEFVFLR